MPCGKSVKVGVWESQKFIGVVIFSSGASHHAYKKYNLDQYSACELTRIALCQHVSTVSRIVKIAISFLKNACPKIRLIVSFADPEQSHYGTIYQAGNWFYTGMSDGTEVYFLYGRWTHKRGSYKNVRPSTPRKKVSGKYRYIYPLDKKIRMQINGLRMPYPKASEA